MTDIRFEEIKEKDIQEVLDIYTHYVLNSTATFHSEPLSVDEMRNLVVFDNDKYKAFLIKEDGNTCGYVINTQFKKRQAYDRTAEVTIYLKPEYIGKGIGSTALRFIEDFAKTKDIHVLVATICGENTQSKSLFAHNGYIKCANIKEVGMKFNQLLDILIYQKILD